MSAKWNYILGTVTIVTIIGCTVYAIKKSKDLEKQEEAAMTVEEAEALVKASQSNSENEVVTIQTTAATLENNGEEVVVHIKKPILLVTDDENDVEDDAYPEVEEGIEGPLLTVEPIGEFFYIEEGINPKEDKTLRFHPDSLEAKHQFIRMELADWDPSHEVYQILLRLYDIPFIPTNDGDDILRTQVIDYKVQFFGWGSKWNKEVSFADVVLHYAKAAEFNCGESVPFWTEHFLYASGFRQDMSSVEFDTLIMRLNSHSHFNEELQTFSLFGISRNRADEAIRIANRNIDRAVTYEIEFNEFLKACMNGELNA